MAVPIACNYDLEVAAAKYLHSLLGRRGALAMHFNGVVYYPTTRAACRWSSSRGRARSASGCRSRCGTRPIEHYYPNTAWVALRSQTLEALERRRVDAAHATFDATVADLLGESPGA